MVMRFAIILVIVACSWGQPRIDIHPISGKASDRLKETERRLRTAQQSSLRDARAEEELAVVEAVARIYREQFQPQISSEPRIATLTEKGNDILVARWTASGDQSPFSELIVWDTPQDTSFIFRLPRRSWSNDAAIRSTFERLLLPARSDGRTPPAKGVTLNIARDPYTQQWIGAGGLLVTYFPRQFEVGYMNWLDLWETTSASYLSATFSLYATSYYPSNMRLIAERFPPLASRVRRWSKQRIIGELDRNVSLARDRVLAQELVKRDLTEDELLALLRSRWNMENGVLFWTIVETHQALRFSAVIRKYLLVDRWADGGWSTIPHPFNIVSRAEDVNFTDVALAVLRQEVRADSAFAYAADHGSLADYRALRELPSLENEYSHAREKGLQRMRTRLGLDEHGNPMLAK
jgi:hypothetical protein